MIEDFERFLIDRFLEFYNPKEGAAFTYIEKRDDRIRNEPSYDYLCRDSKTNTEMGIEVKRLIKKELEYEARLNNYFEKYISKDFNGRMSGTFLFALDYLQIMGLTRDKQKQFFKDMKQIVSDKIENYSLEDISINPKASLLKINDEGSKIALFLNDFSSADEERIEKTIRKAKDKFITTKGTTMVRIILVLEQSLSCRREKIRDIVKNIIIEGNNMDEIDGIYHLAIWRKPGIARVFPEGKIFESKFFDPDKYIPPAEFLHSCMIYFR